MTEENKKLKINELVNFFPLCNMTPDELSLFVEQIEVRQAKKGKKIIELGTSDKRTLFLVRGTVELEDITGKKQLLSEGSLAARNPVSFTDPHQYTITCKSPVDYLRIDNFIIDNLLDTNSDRLKSQATTNKQVSDIEKQLYDKIYKDLTNDKLIIPTLPKIAASVRQAIEKDADLSKVEKLIQADPAMASMLIKAANSALYRTKHSVRSIQQAILRMGFKTLRFLVTSYSVKRLFITKSSYSKKKMSRLWAHSADVAAVSYVLATKIKGFDPETALLLGLLHDIGTVPIISYAEKYPELLDNPDALDSVIDKLRGDVGELILKHWNFSDDFIEVARDAENWQRSGGMKADYCDLVLIAQYHTFIGVGKYQNLPALDNIPAFKKLGLDTNNPEHGLGILADAKEQIKEARSLLVI